MERGLTRQQIFAELAKSPHGKLEEYLNIGQQVARTDPEFLAHLSAWNFRNGQIRDSKVALPVIAIDSLITEPNEAYMSNAQALLAMLPPRDLLRAIKFAKSASLNGRRHNLRKLVQSYLWNREAKWGWWESTAVRHKATMKELYAYYSVKPTNQMVKVILFGWDWENGKKTNYPIPRGSVFEVVANLQNMAPREAAANIVGRKIPFLIAAGALGAKIRDKEILMALIERMSPAELSLNMKKLEEYGVRKSPELRATLEKALVRVADDKSMSNLKLSKTIDAIEDEELKDKVKAVQEKKFDKSSVQGDWLVLIDCSTSMQSAIEVGRLVGETLARSAKGSVHLVFFNHGPRYFNVTGKTLEQIHQLTRGILANGNTSVGCGLNYALENKIEIDGVAIVSDGGENTAPYYTATHEAYCRKFDKNVPTYLYHLQGDANRLAANMEQAGREMQVFPLTGTDYYAIPGLIQTMRTNRYSLMDEIMESPLFVLSDVVEILRKEKMHA